MLEKSQRRNTKDIFFEMFLRRFKDVTEKKIFFEMYFKKVISYEMFLRGLWDVSLNGDLSGTYASWAALFH